jgi:hypothetical protein
MKKRGKNAGDRRGRWDAGERRPPDAWLDERKD